MRGFLIDTKYVGTMSHFDDMISIVGTIQSSMTSGIPFVVNAR